MVHWVCEISFVRNITLKHRLVILDWDNYNILYFLL